MFLLASTVACSDPQTAPPAPPPPSIIVFAAASLTDVLPRAAEAWEVKTGAHATLVFDASSRLAKQLEGGAPADLFVSADAQWMDWSVEHALVRPESRRDLLGNTLVLVVPSGSKFVPSNASDLADARVEHLALAGENVPAGRYARAAFTSLGAWDAVASRVVYGDSVRTALGWVARGEAQAGVVYATDARVEPGVNVAFTFPATSHPPIVYPGAVTSRAAHADEAASFLTFCAGDGRGMFEDAGFTVVP